MKKYNFIGKLFLIVLALSMGFASVGCGSDDPDPVEMTNPDPMADPTNANTTIEATSPAIADGMVTSTVTVTLADTSGDRFTASGGAVILTATGDASVSDVTDNSNGTYSATVTNTTAETVTISGTLAGTAISSTAEITFDPAAEADAAASTIEATATVVANGTATAVVTVTLVDTEGAAFTTSGGSLALTTTGNAMVSEVTDNDDGTYNATVTNTTAEVVTISGTLNETAITVTAEITFETETTGNAEESTEPVGPTILRINSGGQELTIDGITFLKDQYGEGPTFSFTNEFITEIGNTEFDEVFYTERVTKNDFPLEPFSYKIPVENGIYSVKLYWAEVYWGIHPDGIDGGVGSRVFSVTMEGQPIITDIDLYEELGPTNADTRMYDIEVTDGELTITFQSTVDRPKISAIEIFGNGAINP